MPGDFWLTSGNDVSAYIGEDGNVDVERVREDAKILVAERPGLRKLSPAYDRTQGHGSHARPTPTFADLLKPTR